jgi:protein translocase SecG subunit
MNTLIIATVAVSILLIVLIALQEQSSDTPGAFGGGAGGSGSYHTRRGLEKFMFGATVFCGVLFVCLAVLNLVIPTL